MTPPPAPFLFMAIDLGSNAVKMSTWAIGSGGEAVPVAFERHPVRLGGTVFETGLVDPAVADQVVALLAGVRRRLDRGELYAVRAVTTSALREASNAEAVLERFAREGGIAVERIAGEREARLVTLGVLGRHVPAGQSLVLIDIGGGSSEVILAQGLDVQHDVSLALGAVRLHRQVLGIGAPPDEAQLIRAVETIDRLLDEKLPFEPPRGTQCLGMAGTISAIDAMLARAGAPIALEELEPLIATVRPLAPEAIARRYAALTFDRAEVILGGLLILRSLMRRLGLDALRKVEGGVGHGLVEEFLLERRKR